MRGRGQNVSIFFVVVVNASERDMGIAKAGEGVIFSTSCWYLNNGLPFSVHIHVAGVP